MKLVLVSGLSGSGKSVTLHTLEDIGYSCVDNLPIIMLADFIALYQKLSYQQVAIGIDTRSLPNASELSDSIHRLAISNIETHLIFLETRDDILIQRFAETRRSHPFSRHKRTIEEAIQYERTLLADMSALSHKIDTSLLSIYALQQLILQCITYTASPIGLLFESFGFKYGVPLDADFIFDVRCLPSPHHIKTLQDYTGLESPIIDYFSDEALAQTMIDDIAHHIQKWLPRFIQSTRSYLNIAIGCTGGKHRSVYVAEALAKQFSRYLPLVRHRQLSSHQPRAS